MKKHYYLLAILLISNLISRGQVAAYEFSQQNLTYSPLTAETVLWSGTFDNEVTTITIPAFTINGTSYTSMAISSNGFVTFGGTNPGLTYYTPISGTTAYHAAVSGIGVRLANASSGNPKISYNTNEGGEIVVQWQDVKRQAYSGEESLSFQIRLNPSNGSIRFIYGNFYTTYTSTSYTVQVGLRGGSNSDYNNRFTASDWSATTAGTGNSLACRFNTTVYPSSGLTFIWAPPAVASIPFFEGFEEGQTNGNALTRWLSEGTGTYSWVARNNVTTNNQAPRTGSWSANLRGSSTRWIFRSIELTGGQVYNVTLYARQNTSDPLVSHITLSYGTEATIAGMTLPIVAETGLTDGNYQKIEGYFSPGSSGTYYIGIKGHASTTSIYLTIDDISVQEGPDCTPPTMLTVSNITSSSADLQWDQFGGTGQWNLKYGPPGFDPETQGVLISNINTNPYTLSGLNSITDYDVCLQAICGGNTSNWPDPVSFFTIYDPMSGNYTIDQNQPTSGNNLNSFNDLAAALAYGGIIGAITVDVVTASGPYVEQVVLTGYNGSSATNTVTINGNGNSLEFLSTNTNERATLKLDGTDYFVFNNLTIKALGSGTGEFGFAVQLMNNANNNSFLNCQLVANETATTNSFAGFVASNIHNGATGTGETAVNLLIDQCIISGGYYGMSLNGPTTTVNMNLTITNTHVKDFCAEGIRLAHQRNALISGNHIYRTGSRTITTTYMYNITGNLSGSKIINNQIYGFAGSAANNLTSIVYGIYGTSLTADVGNKLLIANNLIYGFQKMNGTQYGVYISGSNVRVLHNTVALDYAAHSGSVSFSLYGIYHTGSSANMEIHNNIIYILSSGNAYKYGLYFNTSGAITSCNNNALFISTASGSNNYVGRHVSAFYATLQNWRDGTGFDLNSVHADPVFSSTSPLPLVPQNAAIDNIGANWLSLVPNDIEGNERTATPDPGAREFVPVCLPPKGLNGSALYATGGSAALLSWTPQDQETSWEIQYGEDGFTLGAGTIIQVSENPYTLTGLDALTDYAFHVRAVCGSEDLSEWAGPAGFSTLCPEYSLPIFHNFDDLTAGQIPFCWSKYPPATANVGASTTSSYSSPNSMRIYGSSSVPVFLISAELTEPISHLQVSFQARYTVYGLLVIGAMRSPAEPETFTEIVSIPLTTSYSSYEAYLSPYQGNYKYLAFKSTAVHAYVDDLLIDFMPPCPTPGNLQVQNTTTNTATISWTSYGNETQWQMVYGNTGFDPETGGMLVDNIDTNPFILTGLNTGKRYQAYLRADCGEDGYSEWSDPITFNTQCGVLELPVEEPFIDPAGPLCWQETRPGGTTTVWNLASTGNLAGGSVPYEAKASRKSTTTSGTTRLIMPPVNTEGIDYIQLHFRSKKHIWQLGGAFFRIQSSADGNTWSAGHWNLHAYYGSNARMDVCITIPVESTVTYIAFVIEGDHRVYDYWAIDDITVAVTNCLTPDTLYAENVTLTSADLGWSQPGTSSLWNVEYGLAGFTPGTGTMLGGVTENPVTISGLDHSTVYEFYVQADCPAEGQSCWAGPHEFRTLCMIHNLTFMEDFSNVFIPACWTQHAEEEGNVVEFSEWYPNNTSLAGGSSGEMVMDWINFQGTSRLVMPELNTTGIESVWLNFRTYIEGDDSGDPLIFKVQRSSDGITWADVPGWSHNTLSGDEGPLTVSLTIGNISSDSLYLAFVAEGDHYYFSSWYIDEIAVIPVLDLPFAETFETDSPSRYLWYQEQLSGNIWWSFDTGSGPNGSLTSAYEGDMNAVFDGIGGPTSSYTYLITPVINLDPVKETMLSFWWSGPGYTPQSFNYISVHYRSGPGHYWNLLATYEEEASGWTQEMMYLPEVGSTCQLAFLGKYYSGAEPVVLDLVTITQDFACPRPVGLTAFLTDISASLDWNSEDLFFDVEFLAEDDPPAGVPNFPGVTRPYLITGLTPDTDYKYYVRTDCGDDGTSFWAGPYHFRTPCSPVSAPTSAETFSTSGIYIPPDCWAEASGEPGENTVISYSVWDASNWNYWSIKDFGNNAASPNETAARINIYSPMDEWLISPPIDLGDGSVPYQVQFDVALTGYNTTASANMGAYKVYVIVSEDGGNTWSTGNIIHLFDNTSVISNTGQTETAYLNGFTGVVRIGFYSWSRSSSGDVDFFIDNFVVNQGVACPPPLSLNATAITGTTATLSWVSMLGNFDIELLADSGTPTGNPTFSNISKPYLLTGLDIATTYMFYVRTNCGSSTSDWAGPQYFTTMMCDEVDVCNYYVQLIDDYGDGWDGTVLGFNQNGIVVATFGEDFVDGYNFGPVDAALCTGLETQIVVVQTGGYTEEKGFIVYDTQDEIVFQWNPGVPFDASYVFHTFTPSCDLPSDLTHWLGTIDSDWENPANWSNGVPGSEHTVIITAGTHYPAVDTHVTVLMLTVDEGADIIITSTGSLTVTGN